MRPPCDFSRCCLGPDAQKSLWNRHAELCASYQSMHEIRETLRWYTSFNLVHSSGCFADTSLPFFLRSYTSAILGHSDTYVLTSS